MKKKPDVTHPVEDAGPEPPDGGWGWLVVLGAHVSQALSLGILTSCGPILVEWLRYFETSAAVTTWVFSLTALVGAIVTPFAAGVAVKIGIRPIVMLGGVFSFSGFLFSAVFAKSIEHLFAFMGVIIGVGLGLIYAPSLLIVGVYFKKNFTFANGLVFLGICTGQLIFPPLFVLLNSKYGWRGALLIFAAVTANVFACGALFRPLKQPMKRSSRKLMARKDVAYEEVESGVEAVAADGISGTSSIKSNEETDAEAVEDFHEKQKTAKGILSALKALGAAFAIPVCVENCAFSIYLLCTFCLGAAFFVPLTHLVNKAVMGGIREEDAAILMTIMGAGSFLGRAGHGWFVDKRYISAQTLMLISLLFCIVEMLTFVLTNIYVILAVLSFLFGIHSGVVVPLTFVIPRLLVKPDQVPPVIGLTLLIHALGNAVGPLLAGWLFDRTGTYLVSFFAGAGIYSLALIFFIPVSRFLWHQHKYGLIIEPPMTSNGTNTENHIQDTRV